MFFCLLIPGGRRVHQHDLQPDAVLPVGHLAREELLA
jgi:hypothetical protein